MASQGTGRQSRMLLRQLLRAGKQIKEDLFRLQQPLGGSQWGTHELRAKDDHLEQDKEVLAKVLPGLAAQPCEPVVSRQAYQRLVLSNFRANAREQDAQVVSERLDEAFSALRGIAEQLYLQQCSSSTTTDGVQVSVTSSFDKRAQLSGGPSAFVFTYRVRIKNCRQQPIKVLGRGWQIRDEGGHIHYEVPLASNAVVGVAFMAMYTRMYNDVPCAGQQPILAPGSVFEYHSGTEISTPTGSQAGRIMVAVLGNGQDRAPTMSVVADVAPIALQSSQAPRPPRLFPYQAR